jgi:hypothetical protein
MMMSTFQYTRVSNSLKLITLSAVIAISNAVSYSAIREQITSLPEDESELKTLQLNTCTDTLWENLRLLNENETIVLQNFEGQYCLGNFTGCQDEPGMILVNVLLEGEEEPIDIFYFIGDEDDSTNPDIYRIPRSGPPPAPFVPLILKSHKKSGNRSAHFCLSEDDIVKHYQNDSIDVEDRWGFIQRFKKRVVIVNGQKGESNQIVNREEAVGAALRYAEQSEDFFGTIKIWVDENGKFN